MLFAHSVNSPVCTCKLSIKQNFVVINNTEKFCYDNRKFLYMECVVEKWCVCNGGLRDFEPKKEEALSRYLSDIKRVGADTIQFLNSIY